MPECPCPISASHLWQVQRDFYARLDVSHWGKGPVPLYITSNPLIARAYAQIILGYLRDLLAAAALDFSEPLYIVELGAGSGRFSFYLRRCLDRMLARSVFQDLRIVLVMTDFVAADLDHWRARGEFAVSIESGTLDFAIFDIERDTTLRLDQSGITLSPGGQRNPMVFVANYVFDGVPQDVFCSEHGRIEEFVARLEQDSAGHCALAFQRRPVADGHYPDPELNQLLRSFQQQPAKSISMPVAALGCLKRLRTLSADRMLLISADKGYGAATIAHNAATPVVAQHGSYSMMVNYDAIGRWVRTHGGRDWHPATPPTGLYCAAFAFGLDPAGETDLAYRQAVDHGGPDDICALKLVAEKLSEPPPWDQALAYLRLSGWDSTIVPHLLPSFQRGWETANPDQLAALADAITRIDQNYFPIGEPYDLAFELGVLLLRMDDYPAAAAQFEKSLARCGADASTLINLALCHYRMDHLDAAHSFVSAGLQQDPTNKMGLLLLRQVT